MKNQSFLVYLLLIVSAANLLGQGCSDAGVCSLGSMNSEKNEPFKHLFSFGQTIEMGEKATFISSSIMEARVGLSDKIFFQARLPFFFASGNLGSNRGFGDLLSSLNVQLIEKGNVTIILTAGGKLATGNANDSNKQGLPLPMPYQASSGSNDLMLGFSMHKKAWHLAMGFQHSLNRNKNAFLHSKWPNNFDAAEYFQSNQLKRGNDLMFRIEKKFIKGDQTLNLGLLPIWRIQKDELINKAGNSIKLQGSNQLTINLNASYAYKLTENWGLQLSLGAPALWRKTRADGLTRFFVFYAGVSYGVF